MTIADVLDQLAATRRALAAIADACEQIATAKDAPVGRMVGLVARSHITGLAECSAALAPLADAEVV